MALRRGLAFLLAFFCLAALRPLPTARGEEDSVRRERALLIGVDEFVSQPSAYPSSTNNVYAMQEMFQAAAEPLEKILVPDAPVTSVQQLTELIQRVFGGAEAGDVSYLYISTHGLYDPENGVEPALLLSDGQTENHLTPEELEAAFDGISGTKVLILDACNSGAFIGKGMTEWDEPPCFLGDDFKVITSSGAREESWYWSAGEDAKQEERQGAFYFTQALCDALSAACGYPADQNHDGSITLKELYDYLLLNHAASTPQVYPQNDDDFVIFRYDPSEPLPTGLERSPIMDVTFSDLVLDQDSREITIEYIAMRPVRLAYQLVYRREGRWEFENAQLIYDDSERFSAFGDQEGAVSAGWKQRTLRLDELADDAYGYALVQLVSIDRGKLRVHAGRVLCVLPEEEPPAPTVEISGSFAPETGRELAVFVGHTSPCTLSVAILDEEGQVVERLCHRRSTRPMGLAGTTLYWDGKQRDGSPTPAGTYRVRAQIHWKGQTLSVESETFELE
ncbi:MAG: caspase family protein [Clostridiales bacterium]|nr:caspase family protein [Clostridiales bacterium]